LLERDWDDPSGRKKRPGDSLHQILNIEGEVESDMIRLGLFILLSSGAILLSRESLRNPRSHGFYRFFAFEFIIGITLINVDLWFAEPFSPVHILSWLLLISSACIVILGFYALRKYGEPIGGVDATTRLVTRGIYRYIRHPLYGSLFLFAWGVFFKKPWLFAFLLAVGASIFLLLTARIEERLSMEKFGESYTEYMKRTKMIIPFLI
jgi:protein-S-isoprenylcysteine O-methyltransferase Ste14